MNFFVLGGDRRNLELSNLLVSEGENVSTYAVEGEEKYLTNNLEEAMNNADAIISVMATISIQLPRSVNTPNRILFCGIKSSVTREITAPAPNTTSPLFTFFLPSEKQKPDKRIKV